MPGKKYEDFVESAHLRYAKLPPYEPRTYISLTCPHCNIAFVSIPQDSIRSNRAGECLKHLRVCEAFKTKGGEVPVAQKRKHDDSTIVELETRIEKMEHKMTSICAENDSLKNENDWLKTENAELETALTNARAAIRSLRKQLYSTQIGFAIMKMDNGLC